MKVTDNNNDTLEAPRVLTANECINGVDYIITLERGAWDTNYREVKVENQSQVRADAPPVGAASPRGRQTVMGH